MTVHEPPAELLGTPLAQPLAENGAATPKTGATVPTSPLLVSVTVLSGAPDIGTLPQSSAVGNAISVETVDSAAPESHPDPCGRAWPRWSVATAEQLLATLGTRSSAGLSGSTTRRVCVGPPWSPRGDSPASVTAVASLGSGTPVQPVKLPSTLKPELESAACAHCEGPTFSATIEEESVTDPPEAEPLKAAPCAVEAPLAATALPVTVLVPTVVALDVSL